MPDRCPTTAHPPPKQLWLPVWQQPADWLPVWRRPGYWLGYSADTLDEKARSLAAEKLDVSPEHIELRRNGGAVLARVREEGGDGFN